MTRWAGRRRRPALPRQHVVPALRHDQEPRQGPPASGDLPAAAAGTVHPAARPRSRPPRRRSVRRPGKHGRRLRAPRRRLRRLRRGRRLSGRSGPPHVGDHAGRRRRVSARASGATRRQLIDWPAEVRPLMRASIAHVLGTAALVALPALVSAQAPAAPAAQAPAAAPAPPPPSVKVGDPGARLRSGLVRAGRRRQGNPPKYEPKRVKLSDFKGKQNVVVAFFPAAFSPGCTNEMKQYQTSHGTFTAANTTILGVSVDSTWSNRAFREQLGVAVPDPERLEARRGRGATACSTRTPASPAAPRSSSTRPASCARSTSAARRSIRPASSACARRSKPIERGPSPARDHPRHRRSRLLHRSRRTAARVAVGDQPADPPARGGAERGRLPARRPAHPHHAGG